MYLYIHNELKPYQVLNPYNNIGVIFDSTFNFIFTFPTSQNHKTINYTH